MLNLIVQGANLAVPKFQLVLQFVDVELVTVEDLIHILSSLLLLCGERPPEQLLLLSCAECLLLRNLLQLDVCWPIGEAREGGGVDHLPIRRIRHHHPFLLTVRTEVLRAVGFIAGLLV